MKKLIKLSSFWILPLLLILFVLFFINIIKLDYRLAHNSHMVYTDPFPWSKYLLTSSPKKFFIRIFGDNKIGLPRVNIYLTKTSKQKLLMDVPASTKIWQKASVRSDKDNIKNIDLRYRGDNPMNWLLEKKSIRIRYGKNQMINRQRYFEYWPLHLRLLVSTNLTINSDTNTSNLRLVELYINDVSNGVYIEYERIDENFLRRHKYMPVNIYKGENYNAETMIDVDYNLFNNPGLWTKNATFNKRDLTDKSDLEMFLLKLQSAETNKNDLNDFFTFIDLDVWAKFCASTIISQNYHQTSRHNMRLIIDPWSGLVHPIVVDPGGGVKVLDNLNKDLPLDFFTNDLTAFLNKNSIFLDKKYEWLNYLIIKEKIIEKELEYLKNIHSKLQISLKRDPEISVRLFYDELEKYKIGLAKIKTVLSDKLYSKPDATWKKRSNNFSISVKNELPVSNIKLYFKSNVPKWAGFDENYNGLLDKEEIKFFTNKSDYIELKVKLFANRIRYANNKVRMHKGGTMRILNTKFDIITENNVQPYEIEVKNQYSGKYYSVNLNNTEGVQKNKLNKIIYISTQNEKKEKYLEFSNVININENLVISEPVKILPGTTFLLSENSNIIFKNQVLALGTISEPIRFVRETDQSGPWGTIALLGKKTNQSIFSNIIFDGGSGCIYKQYYFTSMFSIHNTEDVKVDNVEFRNNSKYDDMLHIVYSNNINLNKLKFVNAFRDALDIDVSSNIHISNSEFINALNDSIDFMESDAKVENSKILGSGDKGISVGENSYIDVLNTSLKNNNIGIAVKDNSMANISISKFSDNTTHISAYKKNWQYSGGGNVDIKKSLFSGQINSFISLDNSKLNINDSIIKGPKFLDGENIIFN